MSVFKWARATVLGGLLSGCVTIPDGLRVVEGFEPQRYLGQWYEIARLDHRFERGLSQVTATYVAREDGGLRVLNRGYDAAKGRWKEAEGRAYLVQGPQTGQLKVSFFGPFYAAYNIIALDPDYRHAMIAGPDRSYLWILSRTPQLPEATLQALLRQAAEQGFATGELVFVAQDAAASSPP